METYVCNTCKNTACTITTSVKPEVCVAGFDLKVGWHESIGFKAIFPQSDGVFTAIDKEGKTYDSTDRINWTERG